MSSGMPKLGSKISLISKANIRYEGELRSVDPIACTVGLSNVRSFGTEDREAQCPVPAQAQLHDFLVFRGFDMKDLQVVQSQPMLPNDPAIVQNDSVRALQQSLQEHTKLIVAVTTTFSKENERLTTENKILQKDLWAVRARSAIEDFEDSYGPPFPIRLTRNEEHCLSSKERSRLIREKKWLWMLQHKATVPEIRDLRRTLSTNPYKFESVEEFAEAISSAFSHLSKSIHDSIFRKTKLDRDNAHCLINYGKANMAVQLLLSLYIFEETR